MRRPLRMVARLLTGSTYVLLGIDAARAPGPRVDQAAATLAMLRKAVPLPADDELIVRGNGAVRWWVAHCWLSVRRLGWLR